MIQIDYQMMAAVTAVLSLFTSIFIGVIKGFVGVLNRRFDELSQHIYQVDEKLDRHITSKH